MSRQNYGWQAQPFVKYVLLLVWLFHRRKLTCTRGGCSTTSNSKMPKTSRVEYTKYETTVSHPWCSLEQLFCLELIVPKNNLCVLDAGTLPILRWLGVAPSWWWNPFLRVRTRAKTAPGCYSRTPRGTKCIGDEAGRSTTGHGRNTLANTMVRITAISELPSHVYGFNRCQGG